MENQKKELFIVCHSNNKDFTKEMIDFCFDNQIAFEVKLPAIKLVHTFWITATKTELLSVLDFIPKTKSNQRI